MGQRIKIQGNVKIYKEKEDIIKHAKCEGCITSGSYLETATERYTKSKEWLKSIR